MENHTTDAEYEKVLAIIEQGYAALQERQNHRLAYEYINRIKIGEPKKAAWLELQILERVPKDNAILQEMARLRRVLEKTDDLP